MKKYCRSALIGAGLVLMTGCQMFTGESLFNPRLSDDAITSSVNQAMMNSQELSTVRVHVETNKGNVVLSGYVKTIRQSDTAGDIAGKVAGVKSVQNDLIVRK